MGPNEGLLAGLLSGAAQHVDTERTAQRQREDEELGFRRHVLDTMMQSVATGNSPPEFLPRILQDYAKTSSATPRARAGGKKGFMGATQMPELSSLMGGGDASSGASAPEKGAGGAAAAQPAQPPQQPPSPAGTGSMADAAGGLASLVPPATAQGAPPSTPGGMGGVSSGLPGASMGPNGMVPPPPPPPQGMSAAAAPSGAAPGAGPFRFYSPDEKAAMQSRHEVAHQQALEKAEYDDLVKTLGPEQAKMVWARKRAGGYIFPSGGQKTQYDPATDKLVTWRHDPYRGIPVDAMNNPVPDDVMGRLTMPPKDRFVQDDQGNFRDVRYGPGVTTQTTNLGRIGKGFAPMYEFRPNGDGTYTAMNRRTGQAGADTGVTAPERATQYEQVDTAVAAKQSLQEVNTAINQELRQNPSANPAQLREQFAKQMGFPSFADLQKAAAQPTKRAKVKPTKPNTAATTYSAGNPFAPKQ